VSVHSFNGRLAGQDVERSGGGAPRAPAAEQQAVVKRLTADLYRLDTGQLYDQVFANLARIDPAVLFERVFANLSRLRSAQLSDQAFAALRTSDSWPVMKWTMANLSRLETARLYGQVSVTLSKVADGFQAAGAFMVLLHEGLAELGWFFEERAGDQAAEAVARDLARLASSLPAQPGPGIDVRATWDPWFRTGLFIAATLLVAAEGPVGPGGSVRATRMVDTSAGLVSLVLAYDAFPDANRTANLPGSHSANLPGSHSANLPGGHSANLPGGSESSAP